MKKYTTLFLDLDNTLLDFYKAENFAIRKTLTKFGLPNDDDAVKTYSAINDTYWKRFEKGEIQKNEIYEGRFKTLLELYNLTSDTKKISEDYFSNLSEGYFTLDGAIEILEYLKDKGYNLYATTNGYSITQFKRVEKSGLAPYFKKVFVSEEAGCQKPEKEYFDYVLANIGNTTKSEILIIGDSQSSDILGGVNSGIDTCWYNPKSEKPVYPSKFEIKSLLEIKNIL